MKITFHLTAKNSSGKQELHINSDVPEDEPNKVAITLVGEYEGDQIQIDFNPIPKETLKSNLKALAEAL